MQRLISASGVSSRDSIARPLHNTRSALGVAVCEHALRTKTATNIPIARIEYVLSHIDFRNRVAPTRCIGSPLHLQLYMRFNRR